MTTLGVLRSFGVGGVRAGRLRAFRQPEGPGGICENLLKFCFLPIDGPMKSSTILSSQ